MLTRRQRMILDAIRAAHAAGFHPSPARLAERIELGGRQAMRADVGRLIIDGEIVGVVEARGDGARDGQRVQCAAYLGRFRGQQRVLGGDGGTLDDNWIGNAAGAGERRAERCARGAGVLRAAACSLRRLTLNSSRNRRPTPASSCWT